MADGTNGAPARTGTEMRADLARERAEALIALVKRTRELGEHAGTVSEATEALRTIAAIEV